MSYTVGPKGQVVIAKEIRDKLGVEPGWVAVQRLVDDHAEVFFLPPSHSKSLKGSLARYARGRMPAGKSWDEARARAWIIASAPARFRAGARPASRRAGYGKRRRG
jgi:AbrB family looped-hinge helix DNA binding protein